MESDERLLLPPAPIPRFVAHARLLQDKVCSLGPIRGSSNASVSTVVLGSAGPPVAVPLYLYISV